MRIFTSLSLGAAATALLLTGAVGIPAARAQFIPITADATIANGNPLNSNYGTNVILIGAQRDAFATRVPNLHVDIVDPAVFTYSNLVGRGVEVYSNTVVSVTGGAIGNGLNAFDQSDVTISGGTIQGIGLSFAAFAPGPNTPHITVNTGATISQNLTGNAAAGVFLGTLTVNGGTLRNVTNNGEGIRLFGTGTAQINGGTTQVISTSDSGALFMTGGTINGVLGSNSQALILQSAVAASISGGTINGGIQSNSQNGIGTGKADISGNVAVNDGVFSLAGLASDINVFGGTFGGGSSPAAFYALGGASINFFGTGLLLSAPTPGSYTFFQGIGSTTYVGNFFTVTGILRDGQSINRVLFDAVSVNGSTAGLGGGFTTNAVSAAAPEPGSLALSLIGCVFSLSAVCRTRKTKAE